MGSTEIGGSPNGPGRLGRGETGPRPPIGRIDLVLTYIASASLLLVNGNADSTAKICTKFTYYINNFGKARTISFY